MENIKKLSLYTTSGEIAGTTYYRIYQYLDTNKYNIRKRRRLSSKMYSNWMPISSKPIWFKVSAFIIFYFRNLGHLIQDYFFNPDIIVLSRSFLNRFFPYSYKILLKYYIYRGTKIIWDFDDDIISSREVGKKDFNWLSKISSKIVVASQNNKEMLEAEFVDKSVVLPTTDRDMYKYYCDNIIKERRKDWNREIKLIWVGTAVSLPFVTKIMPYIEEYAKLEMKNGRIVTLNIVCNKPLIFNSKLVHINNIKWTRDIAIQEMKKSHIGLMPLTDSVSNRRKGGFKLIQYLSIGLPIIGSPVGINARIIKNQVGYCADINSMEQWINGLSFLTESINKYEQYSKEAYKHWMNNYSYESNLNKWNELIEKIAKDRNQ